MWRFPLGGKRDDISRHHQPQPSSPFRFASRLPRAASAPHLPRTAAAMVTVRNPTPKLSDELYKAMQAVLDSLFNQKDAEFRFPSLPFPFGR